MIPAIGPRSLRRLLEGLSRMLGIEQILERLRAVEQRTRAAEDSISAEIESAQRVLQELERRAAEAAQAAQRQDGDLSNLRSVVAERVQNVEAALADEAAARGRLDQKLAEERKVLSALTEGMSAETAERGRLGQAVEELRAGNAALAAVVEAERVARARLETAAEAEAELRAQIEERLADEHRARVALASSLSSEAAERSRIGVLVAGLESSNAALTAKVEAELGAMRELADAHRNLESDFTKELGEREALASRLQAEQTARQGLAESVAKAVDLQRAVDDLKAAADGERGAQVRAISELAAAQEEASRTTQVLREALEGHRAEVSGRLEGIGADVDSMVASVRDRAQESVSALGDRLAGMETVLVSLREHGAALEARLSNLSGGLEEASQAREEIGAALRNLSERAGQVDGAMQGLHVAREQLRSLEQYIKHVDGQITRIDTKSAQQDSVNRSTLLRLFASERPAETKIPVMSFSRSATLPLGNLCSQGSAETAELYFVCSHGRTATHWLTAVLNAHPDFIAAHGPTSPPHLIGSQHYVPPAEIQDPVARPEAFQGKSTIEMRDEMRAIGAAKRYVRVHGLSFAHLYAKMSNEAAGCRVRAVNIVRHPVARAQSFWMHWRMHEDGRRHVPRLLAQWRDNETYRGYERFVSARYPKIDLGKSDARLFLMAIHWVTRDFDDFVLPAEHFPIEWMLQGWRQFETFLELTFGRDIPARDALQKAYRELPRLSAITAQPETPDRIYRGWEPWQRAAFAHLCEDQQLPSIYGRFGYGFSFLRGKKAVH